jgi:hypothetical protein
MKKIVCMLLCCCGFLSAQQVEMKERDMADAEVIRPVGTEPGAGTWRTYAIASPSAIPVAAPPGRPQTAQESNALRDLQRSRTPERIANARYWLAGSPSYRWVELAMDYVERRPLSNPRNTRMISMMNVAVYDAMLVAWRTKYMYSRERPELSDTLVPTPQSPSYPSEHAVAAGAASEILAFFYPDDAGKLRDAAAQQGQATLIAGINFASDVDAGLELGRSVAKAVIQRIQDDGSALSWTGTVPVGPGYWVGTNPAEPLAGTWRPWVLPAGNYFRPGPPPAYDSAEKKAEIEEIKAYPRTFNSNAKAFYYQTFEGIFSYWYRVATQRIFEYGLDANPPRAARVYALLSVAHHDAMIAGWDAKYTYWAMRPFMYDADVKPLFTTPNHPSYPAAHGFFSGAIARMIAYLFPNEAEFIEAKANEAAESRFWAGIHFRSDLNTGLSLGRRVADYVIEQAKRDGSE